MRKYKWSLLKSLEFLNSRRPDLEIRATFIHQLSAYEQRLQKKFNSNIHKRGLVDINSSTKDKEKFTVGPVVLAFFIFVVIGSSLLQMIRTLQTGKP